MALLIADSGLSTLPTSSTTFLIAGWLGALSDQNSVIMMANLTNGMSVQISGPTFATGASIGSLSFLCKDGTGTTIANGNSDPSNVPSLASGWHSFAISGDTATQTIQYMVDLSLITTGSHITWTSSNAIGYSAAAKCKTCFTGGADNTTGCEVYNFYFTVGNAFFDLTNSTNVAKLFAAGNHPVNWGPTGASVTGSTSDRLSLRRFLDFSRQSGHRGSVHASRFGTSN